MIEMGPVPTDSGAAPLVWSEGLPCPGRDTLPHRLIAAHAVRDPSAVAVRQWQDRLTYRELVGRAADLAERLQGLGVGPEVRVGICLRRSIAMPVAVLGVLMAGGAYVPLDPGQPRRRLIGMLDDAGVEVVIADASGTEVLGDSGRRLLEPCTDRESVPPACAVTPGNAAYVIYTSGSTGRPKGVVVSHRSLAAFVGAAAEEFALDPGCRGIGFAALGFDVSVLDMLVPLSLGGTLQLIPDADRVDPARLQAFLEEHQVTWGALPPAILPLLDPERLPSLADVITAGEPPGPEQVSRWSTAARRFHNWYGPTETTVCVVGTELGGVWERPLPIGRPLPGCQAYVLDERMEPCAIGVPGELHIGGPQLARGYLGCPGLTAERFVPDPFGGEAGGRLYRTGDRAIWEPDGRIGYLGRLDRQVKIQGQRVELGEVESVLRRHPQVQHAVVDASAASSGLTELVAYLAPATAPGLPAVRVYCAELLPRFMTPTRVVRLGALPLNTSGKVDMAALRRHEAEPPVRPHTPRTDVQRAVAAVWARVFGTAEAGLDDDFFAGGGHSVLAMRLVGALRAELGREIAVEDVFTARTVGGLAERLGDAPPAGSIKGEPAVPKASPPALSSVQRRLWFVEQLAPDTPAHNIAIAERLRGALDVAALRDALGVVARQHEVLRWRLPSAGGVPEVVVEAPGAVDLPVDDLAGLPSVRQDQIVGERLAEEAGHRFDLATGPLWRVRLLRLAPDDHVLAITVHHIAFDGWSQGVLYRDLGHAYATTRGNGHEQPARPVRYADYVAWLREREQTRLPADLAWWVDHLAGAPTVLDLPRDRPRPPVQTFGGATTHAEVGADLAAGIQALARRLDATPYAVLLAAFGQLLRRLTGQSAFIVGAPFADRRHPAFEELVGCCLQILPIRLRMDDGLDFAAHVRDCGDELVAALMHADAPLERIVAGLGRDRDLSRNPLVQVLFNMYSFAQPRLEVPGVCAEPLPAGLPGSLFDLTLYVEQRDDRFALQVVYNTDLYDTERVEALLTGYVGLLRQLVTVPAAPVGEASLRVPGSPLPDLCAPLPRWAGPGVVERVRQVASDHLDDVAAAGTGGEFTYRDVMSLATRTAEAIAAAGMGPGAAIAVLAARDIRLPAVLLGILQSGARWALLDPALPPGLLARQAAAVNAQGLLGFPGAHRPAALADLPEIEIGYADQPGGHDPAPMEARGYLSFTSGTTGEPNPVVTSEEPLAHFLDWYVREFGLGVTDRFAMLSGLAHDPLLRDVFAPLSAGARLCVPTGDLLRDPVRLLAWMAAERITVVHLTPQLARLLCGAPPTSKRALLPDLRLIASGGDQLTGADVTSLRGLAPNARVVNFFGTTETPQAQACHLVGAEPDRIVPVGHGVPGAQLLVLGPDDRSAGVGELGQVAIRSRHLATGYLDPDLTARRFVRAPGTADPGDRMYLTGDLGRYRPDGAVVLAGRMDDQVKVRGFRVELGEIEAALLTHPDVRAATAVVHRGDGESPLYAYAVPARPGVEAVALRDHLRARVPEYAVPGQIVLLPELPLTPAGKVDRSALPRPAQRPDVPPPGRSLSATEQVVAGIWQEVLDLPRVSAADSFFDIGGHSLAIVTVQARLAERYGREIPVVELFRHPTIRQLAEYLDDDPVARHSPGLEQAARRVAARRERLRRTGVSRPGGSAEHHRGGQ